RIRRDLLSAGGHAGAADRASVRRLRAPGDRGDLSRHHSPHRTPGVTHGACPALPAGAARAPQRLQSRPDRRSGRPSPGRLRPLKGAQNPPLLGPRSAVRLSAPTLAPTLSLSDPVARAVTVLSGSLFPRGAGTPGRSVFLAPAALEPDRPRQTVLLRRP